MKKAIILLILLVLVSGCSTEYPCEISFDTTNGVHHSYTGKFAKESNNNQTLCCVINGYSGNVNKAIKSENVIMYCGE